MIPAAELGDRIGRKRAYVIGLVVFALASAACALAPNVGLLITARVVQGAGGALISPAALALLTGATPPQRRGAVMGIYAAVMGLAVVGGPLVGGAVAQGIAWQWIFWINLPVIAVVLPFAATKLTETKGNPALTCSASLWRPRRCAGSCGDWSAHRGVRRSWPVPLVRPAADTGPAPDARCPGAAAVSSPWYQARLRRSEAAETSRPLRRQRAGRPRPLVPSRVQPAAGALLGLARAAGPACARRRG